MRISLFFTLSMMFTSACMSLTPLVSTLVTTPVAEDLVTTTQPESDLQPYPDPVLPEQDTPSPKIVISPSPNPTLEPAPAHKNTSRPRVEYPGPKTTPATAIPPPAWSIILPPEVDLIVLLGTDTEAPKVGRTDTIILVFFNRVNGNTSLVSVPRDLYVYLPGWNMDRINTAYVHGGFDLLADTLEYNLGIKPSHWVLVHFDGFIKFIDDLGGIDVPVSDPMPNDCFVIPPGVVHMNGETSLCYVRERNTTSDIARSRRQMEVLQVILDQVVRLDRLPQLPKWYARYHDTIQTDLQVDEIVPLIPQVLELHQHGFLYYQVSWDQVTSWEVPETKARVLLPKRDKIWPLLMHAIKVLYTPMVED
jgi:LCP family protein required for cell wall assembly